MDDETLAQQAKKDVEAFAELYRRNVSRVYRYHLAHCGNVADAEDLTSQTFLAVLDGIQTYRASGVFAAWLMGIARRKQALFFRQFKPEVTLEQMEETAAKYPPVEFLAGRRISFQQACEAIKLLNPERAEALRLCFFAGLSAAEAGLILEKSEAAVKMLVSRALQDLRTRSRLSLEVQDEQ